jgi:hypothetical protein
MLDTLRITVTAVDAFDGIPENCNSCALALAVRRVYREDAVVSVDEDFIALDGVRYVMPLAARDFINAYDAGKAVALPFTFEAPRLGTAAGYAMSEGL